MLNPINGYKILDALIFLMNLSYDDYIYLLDKSDIDKSLLFEKEVREF